MPNKDRASIGVLQASASTADLRPFSLSLSLCVRLYVSVRACRRVADVVRVHKSFEKLRRRLRKCGGEDENNRMNETHGKEEVGWYASAREVRRTAKTHRTREIWQQSPPGTLDSCH
jgi:hypothetical protein